MALSVRRRPYVLPSYSLTGDLLAYERCPLAYRYNNVGKLPPSRPLQQWFGEFIHGVMEEGWRRYRASDPAAPDLPPWRLRDLQEMCDRVETRLRAKGLHAWDRRAARLARLRAIVAINELGPLLLPLIERAELRVTGARKLPEAARASGFREADRYEMAGVIDVVTSVTLANPVHANNPIVQAIAAVLPPNLPAEFEVIVDYKGTYRPAADIDDGHDWSAIYDWQLQTYAHLRGRQEGARPVLGGAVIYLNELLPARDQVARLLARVEAGKSEVAPAPGSPADLALRARPLRGRRHVRLPFEFRLARALHVRPVDTETIADALEAFDDVVAHIEDCHRREAAGELLAAVWVADPSSPETCAACDHRTRCSAYLNARPDVDRRPTPPWDAMPGRGASGSRRPISGGRRSSGLLRSGAGGRGA